MSDDEADDADIYDNLPNFFLDETYKNLEEEKKELKIRVEELGKQLDEIKKENEILAIKVKALGKNISCLYKTAVRELERKDQIIADLRKERDDLLFRRGLKNPLPTATKRSSRKQLTPTKKVRNGNIKRPDQKTKTITSMLEDSSSIAKAVETVELEPPKEKTPERILPSAEASELKEVSPKSETIRETPIEKTPERIISPVKTTKVKEMPSKSESKRELPIAKSPERVIPPVKTTKVKEMPSKSESKHEFPIAKSPERVIPPVKTTKVKEMPSKSESKREFPIAKSPEIVIPPVKTTKVKEITSKTESKRKLPKEKSPEVFIPPVKTKKAKEMTCKSESKRKLPKEGSETSSKITTPTVKTTKVKEVPPKSESKRKLPKEKSPEVIIPLVETAEVEEMPSKSEDECETPKVKSPEVIIPLVETTEVNEITSKSESKPEENPNAVCNSKEETFSENSFSEKTPVNVSNIQILSGSEDSFVKTPASEKFTSHAMVEDCGFGRRRKVRRIIRASTSSASSTPARSDINIPGEDQAPSAKRIRVEADLSSTTVSTSADKSPSSMEVDTGNNSNAIEESACERASEDATSAPENSLLKDPSVPPGESDFVLPSQEELVAEIEKESQPEQLESDPNKGDETCEIDLKLSSTDEQSINSGNLSFRSQSDCSSLTPVNHTAAEIKAKTTSYVEEYSVSSIEFDRRRHLSPGGSSTPKSDISPGGDRGKRSRSWERERNHPGNPNQNQDDDRRMRRSNRDSYRDRDRRDPHYGRDYRSSRSGDRVRRMDRDPRGDRNYRSRVRDHGDDRSRGPDSVRQRDDESRRDAGRHGRTRSRERRDSFHGSSSRNRDGDRRSHPRDRGRKEMEEGEISSSRSRSRTDIHYKSDRSPKQTSLQSNDHIRSNCIPPTEWD